MYRLIVKIHMDGEEYNNDLHAKKKKKKKHSGRAKYIVNLGKN